MHKSILLAKPLLFLCLVLLLSTTGLAQASFEPGYYVDNNGIRVEGLIRNMPWEHNPGSFKFKPTAKRETQTLSMEKVRAFGIDPQVKFVRAQVLVDQSTDMTAELSPSIDPLFTEKTVFLKVLVEGEARLYTYSDRKVERFFYQKDPSSEIEPLIYKRYRNAEGKVFQNNQFRRQLLTELPCEGIQFQTIEEIRYKTADLLQLFETYNTCRKAPYEVYQKEKPDLEFAFSIRPGLSFPALSTSDGVSNARNANFERSLAFRIGGELELAFSSKKMWTLFIEPTFSSYKRETEAVYPFSGTIENTIVSIKYQYIEFPIGVRRYLQLGDKSRLFANGAFIFDSPFNSYITFQRGNETLLNGFLKIQPNLNFAAGVGYNYQDQLVFEFRYHSPKNILNTLSSTSADFNVFSLIAGFRLF
jgi:hypothetical protein